MSFDNCRLKKLVARNSFALSVIDISKEVVILHYIPLKQVAGSRFWPECYNDKSELTFLTVGLILKICLPFQECYATSSWHSFQIINVCLAHLKILCPIKDVFVCR